MLNVHVGQIINSVTIMGPSLTLIVVLENIKVCWQSDDQLLGFWFDIRKDMIVLRKEILIVLLTPPNY
jgi:hypothetical protein